MGCRQGILAQDLPHGSAFISSYSYVKEQRQTWKPPASGTGLLGMVAPTHEFGSWEVSARQSEHIECVSKHSLKASNTDLRRAGSLIHLSHQGMGLRGGHNTDLTSKNIEAKVGELAASLVLLVPACGHFCQQSPVPTGCPLSGFLAPPFSGK